MFFEFDFDSLLLGLLSFMLGKSSLDKAREKSGVSKILSRAAGCIFVFTSLLYFFGSFDFGPDDRTEDEDGEEADEA